jgi:hypothetical protein
MKMNVLSSTLLLIWYEILPDIKEKRFFKLKVKHFIKIAVLLLYLISKASA